jgi:hypothetical protein
MGLIPGAMPRTGILRAADAASQQKLQAGYPFTSVGDKTSCSEGGLCSTRNFFLPPVFAIADSFFEFAQYRILTPTLDPQVARLSIEGRAVPDYGAPILFFLTVWACPASPPLLPLAIRSFPYLSRC